MKIGEPRRTREIQPLAEPVPEQIPVPVAVEAPTPATEPVEPRPAEPAEVPA